MTFKITIRKDNTTQVLTEKDISRLYRGALAKFLMLENEKDYEIEVEIKEK